MEDQTKDQNASVEPTTETTTPAPATEPVVPAATPSASTAGQVQAVKGSNNLMMYLVAFLITLLVVGGAALYFLSQEDDSDNKNETDTEESADKDEDTDSEENDVEEDSDEDTNSEDGNYSNSDFSFEYPEDFYLDSSKYITSETVTVYRVNPDDLDEGDFNDNISVRSLGAYGETTISEADCESFGESVVNELETNTTYDYENVSLTSTDSTKLNGQSVCVIKFKSTYSGVDILQEQYLFVNEDEEGDSYLVTLTSYPGSSSMSMLRNVAESFEMK